MRVLIACEFSGVVREAFRQRGHDAWSCDLRPASDSSRHHLQVDVNLVLNYPLRVLGGCPRWMIDGLWDLLIAHPPCTYLCNSSVWAFTRTPPNPTPGTLYGEARWAAMLDAVAFFNSLLLAKVPRVCVENPIMHGHARDRLAYRHAQIVQPYEFGDDARKATCLWLKGLPRLVPTRFVPPRVVDGKPRWANQTDGGQNKLTPSATRWMERSTTYRGIAEAMADQWGTIGQSMLF